MNEGVRAMLRAAVADPANQRFVLLSESCAPLHHPAVLHQQLTHETLSRVDACGRGNVMWERWTWRLEAAGVPATAWRKGSQWTALTRDHAQLIVDDTAIAAAFARHCTYGEDADTGGWRACVPDESYVPTLLAVHGRDNETDCRGGLTAVDWARKEGTGAHPHRFAAGEVDAALVRRLRRQDEPFVLCDADGALDLALRSYVGVDDVPASAALHRPSSKRRAERPSQRPNHPTTRRAATGPQRAAVGDRGAPGTRACRSDRCRASRT